MKAQNIRPSTAILIILGALWSGCAQNTSTPETQDVEKLAKKVEALYQQGRYAEAIPIATQLLHVTEKSLGPDHPDTATRLSDLAELDLEIGNYVEAGPLFERALTIREKALGPEHLDTVWSLDGLGRLYQHMGDYGKAEPFFQRALAIQQKVLGPDHRTTAAGFNNLALLTAVGGAGRRRETS
jgi:tetratricopeptide (TPR) repeat protein